MLPLWAALGVVAVAIALIALLAGRDRRQTFDPTSPEAAVQTYLDAVLAGDPDTAATMLDDATANRCLRPLRRTITDDGVRASLLDARIETDRATIEIQLTYPDGDLFGTSSYSFEERFFLERVDGEWLITEDPWPVALCR
jgi:hypothetical protein